MPTAGILLATTLLAVPNASSPPTVAQVYGWLEGVRNFHNVAISADGTRVAWSQKVRDAEGRDRLGRISVALVSGGAPTPITASADRKPAKEKFPVFSPDGRTLAFLSDAGLPGQQPAVARSGGGRRTAAADEREGSARRPALVAGRQVQSPFFSSRAPRRSTGALVAYKRATPASSAKRSRSSASRSSTSRPAASRRVARRTLRLRLRLVARRQVVRGGGRRRTPAPTTTGSRELYVVRAARPAATRSIWKPSPAARRSALFARRQVDRGHPRHHERRGQRRRRL